MTENKLQKFICANCGYLYDPAQGGIMNHVPPGAAFEHLPEGWVCPVCYVTKDQFDPLD